MGYIRGVICEVCGTTEIFRGNHDNVTMSRILKKEGWRIVRKNGQIAEQTYCPYHSGKEYSK